MDSIARRARVPRRLLACAAALVGIAFASAIAAQQSYEVRLRPVPIEASTAATTTGMGEATAQLSGARLTVRGNFTGLQGAATVARLHQGAVMGVRGPAFADLTVSAAASGTVSGEVTLTELQLAGLRQGHVYLQIHSESAPDGNLWGWLLR
jgi:hypothetical protein